MRLRRPTVYAVLAATVIVLGVARGDAHAQAWVSDKGTLELGLDYNLGISSKVVVAGADFDDAGSQTHQIALSAEYTPIQHLAVNLSLPLVFLKYTGDRTLYPHPGGGSYDDGSFHTTLTDLRAGARYQVLEDPVAIAPHLAFSIPVADYETIGNTVAGRHLKMLHAGVGIGTVIGLAAYVHLLYEFTFAEKYDRTDDTAKYGQYRSDVSFTIGYKLLGQRLDLSLGADARFTHDGVGIGMNEFPDLTADEATYHDAILKENIVLAGAGVGYQITNSISASVAARIFVTGKNTQNASVIALGIDWTPISP